MISLLMRSLGVACACAAWLAAASPGVQAEGTAPAPSLPLASLRADSAAVPFPTAPVRHWQVGLLRPDRMRHASLSLTLGLAAGLVTRQPPVAACGSLALGLAKELYDVRGNGFDPVDLFADALGAGAAALGTRFVED